VIGRIRSPDRPAHSESLYRLRYPSPHQAHNRYTITIKNYKTGNVRTT
jgi:hypothetical protein